LEIVIAGRLAECAPAVLILAIADLEKGDVFPAAVQALKVVGNGSDFSALAASTEQVTRLPARVCVPLSELLFPGIWSVADLFHALGRMETTANSGNAWDYPLSEHLAATVSEDNGLALLKGFLGYPLENKTEIDDYEAPWSVRTALAICDVMLDWERLSEAEALAIAEVLVRASDRIAYLTRENALPERTHRHPNMREQYFRLAAERLAKEHGERFFPLSSVTIFNSRLPVVAADILWILRWLEATASDEERRNVVEWSLDVWQQTGRTSADLARIKCATKQFPDTRRLLWKYFHPGFIVRAKRLWYRRIHHYFYRYRWKMAWRKMRRTFHEFRYAWNLWRYREKMRSGEYVGLLANLVLEACGTSGDQWSPSNWSLLEKKRGAKCAAAVKEGCRRVWGRYEPPLPHERKLNGGVAYGTLAGLAGIKIAWQEGQLCFAELSLDDARRATRYALSEINGFTPWFNDLIRAQPEAVRSVLTDCISAEWEIPADSEHHHLVLYNLARTESAAGDLIKATLMERLADSEPKNVHVLREALCIVVVPPSPQSGALAALAERRSSAFPVCAPSFPSWMALWLQADASSAIDALELRLSSATDPYRVLASICANLSSSSGFRLPLLENPSWLKPAAMRRFIPLVYRYIRREDDIDRPAGVSYSPTERDDVQSFRGELLARLAAMGDPEVGAVLQEFLSEPLLSHLSDYIRHLLDKHRGELSEGRTWRARDVRDFATDYERDPQTDADLFKIALRRLFDLKQWVEVGEDSPREEVNPENNEAGFRRWLQRRLNEKSRDRYVIPQEWEIDGAVRPDLRLVIPNTAPVSLELKIADNWTLPELLDGLETQLVGTYLRDHRARYGIYVLALFNRARKWGPIEKGPRINSEQMLEVLRKRIEEILAVRVDIAGLDVVLIDFAP
jgi:hypothetical protein